MVGERADHVAVLLLLLPTGRCSARCLPNVVVDNDCCVDGVQKRICTRSCRLAALGLELNSTGDCGPSAQPAAFQPRNLCAGRLFLCSFLVLSKAGSSQTDGLQPQLSVRRRDVSRFGSRCKVRVCVYSECLLGTRRAKFVLGPGHRDEERREHSKWKVRLREGKSRVGVASFQVGCFGGRDGGWEMQDRGRGRS